MSVSRVYSVQQRCPPKNAQMAHSMEARIAQYNTVGTMTVPFGVLALALCHGILALSYYVKFCSMLESFLKVSVQVLLAFEHFNHMS